MIITPFVIGHGRSSQVITQALSILNQQLDGATIAPPRFLERGESLAQARETAPEGLSLAVIANPHGLHSDRILEADRAGFHGVLTEKPACTTLAQAESLRKVKTKTAVFHVYRQMWGPQTLKKMIENGEFGEMISIEGRYWQSSTADRAITGPAPTSWKNKIDLSGPSDTLLDVGTHWADMAIYFAGAFPAAVSGWSSYANSETPHRDSHIHLMMEFESKIRAMSSITKNSHGSTNHFEINLFGTRASATWQFLAPDEIFFGQGRERRVITRQSAHLGTRHPAFHGAGWLEGYVEIARQLINDLTGLEPAQRYPTLPENVRLIETLLSADILRKF
jgi:predicted dehydrogenase